MLPTPPSPPPKHQVAFLSTRFFICRILPPPATLHQSKSRPRAGSAGVRGEPAAQSPALGWQRRGGQEDFLRNKLVMGHRGVPVLVVGWRLGVGSDSGLSFLRRCPPPAPPGWWLGRAFLVSSPSQKRGSETVERNGGSGGKSAHLLSPGTRTPHLLVRGGPWHSSFLLVLLLLLGFALGWPGGAQGEGGAWGPL